VVVAAAELMMVGWLDRLDRMRRMRRRRIEFATTGRD
jgi:hypothetical protein